MSVICGAPNVSPGAYVAWVPPGTSLGGKRIGTALIDGVHSQGMLASAAELGISRDHSGLLVLETGLPGQKLDGLKPDWVINPGAYTAVDNEDFPLPAGERTIYQGRHPLGDLLAERAIQLIGANLRQAVANGRDLAARDAMALGATLAGMAFSNVGVAAVHQAVVHVGLSSA